MVNVNLVSAHCAGSDRGREGEGEGEREMGRGGGQGGGGGGGQAPTDERATARVRCRDQSPDTPKLPGVCTSSHTLRYMIAYHDVDRVFDSFARKARGGRKPD
jgi:hypothetical protein